MVIYASPGCDFEKLRAFNLAVLACSQEIRGGALGRISFVKLNTSIGFQHYKEVGLPVPLFLNFEKYGIFPIDTQRWMYSEPYVYLGKKTIEIPNGIQGIALEYCKNILGEDKLEIIKEKVLKEAKCRGLGFTTWMPRIGDFVKEYIPLGKMQIEETILTRSENPYYWIVNPEWLDTVETRKTTMKETGIEVSFLPIKFMKKTIKCSSEEKIKILNRLVHYMVKNKKNFFKSNEGWRFRIYKANFQKSLNKTDLNGIVLYVGQCLIDRKNAFFVDTYYIRSTSDFVRMRIGNELKNRLMNEKSLVLLTVGELLCENDDIILIPYGILKVK